MDEMLKRVVSTRGPYDTFTGDRSKPMICGHRATEVRILNFLASSQRIIIVGL